MFEFENYNILDLKFVFKSLIYNYLTLKLIFS